MPDDAAVFLADSGKEPRNVFEDHEWNVKGVAEPDETRPLVGGVNVQHPRENGRLVGHDADGVPP